MRRFGLIGKTLKHSFSKNYFTRKFEAEGITGCSYENFELEQISQLASLVKSDPDIQGLNVTIPYKEQCLPFLDETSEAVRVIGACNCIRINGGKMHGYNTDAPAFMESIRKFLKSHHRSALVLGSGGASKAITYALGQLGIENRVVSRNPVKENLGYEDLNPDLIRKHTVLINTTPLGMFPDTGSAPQIPYEAITNEHLLYDLTYNPERTQFLLRGLQRGATVVNGYEMLVGQAEESWKIWNE
jgi:shikimate dehydrogenase